MLAQPAHRAADHRAGGAAEQESACGPGGGRRGWCPPPRRAPPRRRRTRPAAAGARPCPGRGSSGARRATEGHRADGVHGDDPHRPVPLPEEAGAAHQGPGGAGADEQHVQFRELPGDRRRRRAVVRLPVARVGVLVQPDVPVVGGAQRADVVDPRTEEAADGSGSVMMCTWLPSASISRRVARLQRESVTQRNP